MKTSATLLTLLCALFALTTTRAVADDLDEIGRLHRIDIRAQHPKAYHPQVGDLITCYFDFPVVPEQIPEDLQVSIEGKSVALVCVVNTSQPKIVGSGQFSVFLVPRQAGLSHVTITPHIYGVGPAKAILITFQVRQTKE